MTLSNDPRIRRRIALFAAMMTLVLLAVSLSLLLVRLIDEEHDRLADVMQLRTSCESPRPPRAAPQVAEYQGPPTPRHMTLSRSPCDFRPVDPTGENGPLAESGGTATLINWNVGAEPLALVAGETYYFNYRNTNCAQASCDASTSTNWPH